MVRSLAIPLAAALACTAACRDGDEGAPSPGERSAGGGSEAPVRSAGATPAADPDPEADRTLVEVLAEAKKLLAADRTGVQNRRSFEEAVERQRRVFVETGMETRIPKAPLDREALRKDLAAHAGEYRLELVDLVLGTAAEGTPVPAEHEGEGPYAWEIDQLVERTPVQVTLRPADDASLRAFWGNLPLRPGPMLDLNTLSIEAGNAVFTGWVYARRDVAPPVHRTRTPSAAELAAKAGVALPESHPRLAEVGALLEQHRALHAELEPSMRALAEAHLLAVLFRFYRERAKDIESRGFPEERVRAVPGAAGGGAGGPDGGGGR